MNQQSYRNLLHRLFSSAITKSGYDELKERTPSLSDDELSDELQRVWNKHDFGKAMPMESKMRVRQQLDRSIGRQLFVGRAIRLAKVAAAIALPVLLTTTVYLLNERKGYVNQQADLLNIAVAKGEKATVNLPDGSTVTLNSESKLYYPSNFNSQERWIKLEGEAYFHVMKSNGRSFTVKTKNLNVRVLGTTFNVSAYNDDASHSVVLVNGSVEVNVGGGKPHLIKPNEMFAYNAQTGKAVVEEVDTYSYTGWKDGILSFESEPIANVLEKVSRQFDVDFQYDATQFGNDKLTGKLDLNDGVESVMKVISLATPITYKKHKNKIVIAAKP